jgi:predicted Fe-S protein YdhL (DUF1289 family)
MTEEKMVDSPCKQNCRLHEKLQWCLGCGRSLEEIAQWPEAGNGLKRNILARLPLRRLILSGLRDVLD